MEWVFLAVGVFLGWFFLPTPEWARLMLRWILIKIPYIQKYVKRE